MTCVFVALAVLAGGILAKWGGVTQLELKAPALVELREMDAEKGSFVFLFNHGEKMAEVEFAFELERPAVRTREILSGETQKVEGKRFVVKTHVPPQAVRVYRIDY